MEKRSIAPENFDEFYAPRRIVDEVKALAVYRERITKNTKFSRKTKEGRYCTVVETIVSLNKIVKNCRGRHIIIDKSVVKRLEEIFTFGMLKTRCLDSYTHVKKEILECVSTGYNPNGHGESSSQ